MQSELQSFLDQSAALHQHLCPRQVLGVRMGLFAAHILQVPYPQRDKRFYTFVETDGCFADGVSVATGCTLGHRTMRLMDHGKIAATFVDTQTTQTIRLRPRLAIREVAYEFAPNGRSRWHTQLNAYKIMPVEQLLETQPVHLTISLEALISRAGIRTACDQCGEEIINGREIIRESTTLCRACAGDSYFVVESDE